MYIRRLTKNGIWNMKTEATFSIWKIQLYLNILVVTKSMRKNFQMEELIHGKCSYSIMKHMKDAHILSIFQWNANIRFQTSYRYDIHTEIRDSNTWPSEQTGRPGYILHQGAVGERKDEDKEKIDAYKLDAYFGHTFVVETLGCVCQSMLQDLITIQNKNM